MYFIPKVLRKIWGMPAIKNVKREEHTKTDVYSVIVDSRIGRCSYIGEHTSVLHTEIGRFCSISNYCAIGGGSHTMDWVSSSPVFNSSNSILHFRYADNKFEPFQPTIIGNDVWIGSHCLIKGGIKIGDGAVIGMGSVVTKDIGSYEVWAGNPARFIRKRFDDDTIEKIKATKWWDWDEDKLIQNGKHFNNPVEFIHNMEEKP